jgi:hypothetical protein
MSPNEMIKHITEHEWYNSNTKEICAFSWGASDQSMNLEIISGDRYGKKESHRQVKVYLSKGSKENCTGLSFQSNLFTSDFLLCPDDGHLQIHSQVFGDLELELQLKDADI